MRKSYTYWPEYCNKKKLRSDPIRFLNCRQQPIVRCFANHKPIAPSNDASQELLV